MKRIKILHIGKYFPPYAGGMETVLQNICEGLKEKYNLKVIVGNTFNKTIIEDHGFKLIRMNSFGVLFSQPITPSLPYLIKNDDSDIIHIHLPNPLAELSILSSRTKAKIIAHFHSDIVRQKIVMPIYKNIQRAFYKRCDKIIVPTPHHISASKFLLDYVQKCVIIPFGISISPFDYCNPVKEENNLGSNKNKKPKLLFVGRLVYYKGIEYLVNAMKNIDAHLFIIGSGPLYASINSLILQNKLQEKVFLLGRLSNQEMFEYYKDCDIFILPSIENSEMFGIVQLEAMAYGKPVVSTNLPTGVSWVNQHNITGLLIEPKNSVAIENAVNFLLENDEVRTNMGISGRKRVEELFTIEKMVDSISSLYVSLIH